MLEAGIQQFYELRSAPPEVHVPGEPDDRDALESWLSERAGRNVRILVPQRGEKRGMIDLANRNAALAYQTRFNQTTAAQYDALETLQSVLALPAIPRRIECFDISTIQGSETVASMVVCEDGRMRRGEYRKYRIRGGIGGPSKVDGPSKLGPYTEPIRGRDNVRPAELARPPVNNDFAAMHEVVLRRYRKLLEQGGPFPDLILIDGGKGQLSAAYAALEELGLANLVAIGIAKKEELLYTRDHVDPIALAPHDPALLLVQRIRDEAHRFAVSFHRRARIDARPPVGARSGARHRSAPPAHAADDVRQRGGRPARDARRAARPWWARKPPISSLRFSRVGRNLYFLLDIHYAQVLISFIVLLFSLTIHEMAHAWTADRLGDPTARLLGRVSLNPLVHADPIGTFVLPLIAIASGVRRLIGWAKPVPVNVRNLRHGSPRLRDRRRRQGRRATSCMAILSAVAAALDAGGAGDAR